MLRENLEAEWGDISDKLRSRFPKLSAADLVLIKGQEEEMIERICIRLKKTRQSVLDLIATL